MFQTLLSQMTCTPDQNMRFWAKLFFPLNRKNPTNPSQSSHPRPPTIKQLKSSQWAHPWVATIIWNVNVVKQSWHRSDREQRKWTELLLARWATTCIVGPMLAIVGPIQCWRTKQGVSGIWEDLSSAGGKRSDKSHHMTWRWLSPFKAWAGKLENR